MLKSSIKRLSCGIMFDYSFSLLDEWGKIVDALLYKNNNYFSANYFPNISQQYTTSRFLRNDAVGHSLHLSANNLIYTHVIQKDFDEEYNEFVLRMEKYLVPNIIEKYELITHRLGMVYECTIDNSSVRELKNTYFCSEVSNEIINCSFAIQSSAPQKLVFSDGDYINKIYTVGGANRNLNDVSFDYQLCFQPAQMRIKKKMPIFFEVSKDCFFDEFFKEDSRAE